MFRLFGTISVVNIYGLAFANSLKVGLGISWFGYQWELTKTTPIEHYRLALQSLDQLIKVGITLLNISVSLLEPPSSPPALSPQNSHSRSPASPQDSREFGFLTSLWRSVGEQLQPTFCTSENLCEILIPRAGWNTGLACLTSSVAMDTAHYK